MLVKPPTAPLPTRPGAASERPFRVLFVCSRNRLRSPTAEAVFAGRDGLEVLSAGTNRDADVPLTAELAAWADLICAMEPVHRAKLTSRFGASLSGTRVTVLGIPDRFRFMEPALVALLERKVGPLLR